MKQFMNKNNMFTALLALLFVFAGANTAAAAQAFNTDPQDTTVGFSTVGVSNYTRNPGCMTCWSSSTTAAPGEIVSVTIYYHNPTGNPTATNTVIRLSNPSGNSSNFNFNGSVNSATVPAASGNASVSISSAQTLRFIPGSASWYPNQTSSPQQLPNGQNGSEAFGSGINIGSVAPGWNSQGAVVLRFQVGTTSTPAPTPAPMLIPTVTTQPATNITATSATLNATYDAQGSATTMWFEFGTTMNLGQTVGQNSVGTGSGNYAYTATGLTPGTQYFFRAVGQNANGTNNMATIRSFTTASQNNTTECNDGIDNDNDGDIDMNDDDCSSSSDNSENGSSNQSAPDVTTENATNVSEDSATLNGEYDANGASTTTWFEYGTSSSSLNRSTSHINQGTGSDDFAQSIGNLSDDTTYYFRAVAQNSRGTDYGSVKSFRTEEVVNNNNNDIVALTSVATGVGQSTAVLNGVVQNPDNENVTGWFEYGTTTGLGQTTSVRNLGSSTTIPMSQQVSGLVSNTTYYFRAVARADNVTSRGEIFSFRTAAFPIIVSPTPTPTPAPVTVINTGGTGQSQFVFLKIENRFESVFSGDTINYTVTYRNISNRTLNKVVIEVQFPKEVKFARASEGEYDSDRKVLVITLGTLAPGQEGTIAIDAVVLSAARTKDFLLTNAVIKYTNPITTVQEEAIAYVINKVMKAANDLGAASIFGDGSFLPTTLVGWLLLILVIAALVYFGRKMYVKKV